MSGGRQPEVDFLHHWGVVWFKRSGKSVFLRENKLSNTNFLAPRHKKRGKTSLPIYVRRSDLKVSDLSRYMRISRRKANTDRYLSSSDENKISSTDSTVCVAH